MAEEVVNFFIICFKNNPRSFFLAVTYDDPTTMKKRLFEQGIDEGNFAFIKSSFDDVPKYFSLAHIGILLRKQELLNRVSCPLKFGEYLAAGIPVVLTKGIGDTESIVQENNIGIIVNELHEDEYMNASKKVTQLLEDSEIKKRCQSVAKNYFSLNTSAEQYFQIYTTLS